MDKTAKYRNHVFICRQCKKEYSPKSHKKIGTTEFCGRKCKTKFLTIPSINKSCKNCGNDYLCSIQQNNRSNFCGQECIDKFRYNQVVGDCHWCFSKVKRRPVFISDIMFCSTRCHSDHKNYNTEPKHYRKKKMWYNIKNEIPLNCEMCKTEDLDVLTVHHKDFNSKNNSLDNLVLLCYNCHYKIHHDGTLAIRKYIKQVEKNHAFKKGKI